MGTVDFKEQNEIELKKLKLDYNYWLKRYENAEKFFKTATIEQVEKNLGLFNEVVRKLSGLLIKYKMLTGREMTPIEEFEGFRGVY